MAALAIPAAVVPERGLAPLRHWLALPRGRGPSQTPKFLSPGPPSPWLPALLIENRLLSFLRRTHGLPPAVYLLCRSNQCRAGLAPLGHLFGRLCKCRPRLNPGDARGEAPCIRKQKISPFPPGRALCERGRGDGGKKETKGGGGGQQRRQAPHCVFHSGRDSQCRAGASPPSPHHRFRSFPPQQQPRTPCRSRDN